MEIVTIVVVMMVSSFSYIIGRDHENHDLKDQFKEQHIICLEKKHKECDKIDKLINITENNNLNKK